jgi:NADH-quinone oxidoreductase subunit L
MSADFLIGLLLAAPLIGFLLNGLRFRSKNCTLAGSIATGAAFISFLCAVTLFFKLKGLPVEERSIESVFFNWIPVAALKIQAGFVVDQISAIMILIITGVGSLIHLFSVGYMSHDERPAKYFAYLNLFLFNMLVLVLGSNLLMTFVGWEGVGYCSYFLIGFWFTDREKSVAGMKAFITNRIGDAGFLIGIFLLFLTFGTLDYSELAALVPQVAEHSWLAPVTLACLFLFVGATGKSAQIPLYVWLPDAMAGPTPVSALIHAATMVTAGIYLIVRMSALFMVAPLVMGLVAWIGALTALFAATIGLTQWDIKKVLAYSTISQLGYMFLAVGVGAFHAGMFHLMTHAFFKALMFLGAGSVIHAMHHEQDMRKMGGLAKKMPITYLTFMAGWFAIIGMPPFAGFFSKDEILAYAFFSPLGSKALWAVGLVAAVFTAFYMTRLMALTFWGKARYGAEAHPHESPSTMTLPLMVLGVLSVIGGWIGIPHVIGSILPGHPGNVFEHWLEPAIHNVHLAEAPVAIEWGLMGLAVALAGLAAFMAYDFYVVHRDRPEKVAKSLGPLHGVVDNKYYVDEGYFAFIINPVVEGSKALWVYVDMNFIDKITYWLSDLAQGMAQLIRTLQNGKTQQYALYMTLGLFVVITYVLMGS